jgi:hypothetical protein
MDAGIIGTGSVLVEQISSGSISSLVRMNGPSTCSGGTRLDSGILELAGGSNPVDGGTIGTATLTLNGGTLQTVVSVTIGNAFALTANSAVTCGSSLTFTGTLAFGSHRLTKYGLGALILDHVRAGTLDIQSGTVKTIAKATPNDPSGTSVATAL